MWFNYLSVTLFTSDNLQEDQGSSQVGMWPTGATQDATNDQTTIHLSRETLPSSLP